MPSAQSSDRSKEEEQQRAPNFPFAFLVEVQMRVRKCENRYGLCVSVCEGEVEAGKKLADFQLLFKYTNMDLVYECKELSRARITDRRAAENGRDKKKTI